MSSAEGAQSLHVLDGNRIRIALMPVGRISPGRFERYARALAAVNGIDVHVVDRTEISSASSNAFPFSEGLADYGQLRILFVDAAYSTSPWDALQASRQVLAVVGICYCPETDDFLSAWESFLLEVQSSHVWRGAISVHCIAIDPGHHREILAGGLVGKTLHFVNDEDFERRGEQGEVPESVRSVLHTVGAELLHGLEQRVVSAEAQLPWLITPNDGGDARDKRVMQRRGPGRVCKRQADLSFLAGCNRDAAFRYFHAIELCRSSGDALWQAAASEAFAGLSSFFSAMQGRPRHGSLFNNSEPKSVPNVGVSSVSSGNLARMTGADREKEDGGDEVGDLLLEAAALYEKRKAHSLQCQALLRFARYVACGRSLDGLDSDSFSELEDASDSSFPRVRPWGSRSEVFPILAKVEAIVGSLQIPDQIEVLGSMALLAYDLRCYRKFSYLVWKISHCHAASNSWHLALDSLLLAAPFCVLEVEKLELRPTVLEMLKQQQADLNLQPRKEGWWSLQESVLFELIHHAKLLNDDKRVAQYLGYYIAMAPREKDRFADTLLVQTMANDLRQRSLSSPRPLFLPFLQLPRVLSAQLMPSSESMRPLPSSTFLDKRKPEQEGAGVFLYCAFDKGREREEERPVLVMGETAQLRVELVNNLPCAIAVEVLGAVSRGVQLQVAPIVVELGSYEAGDEARRRVVYVSVVPVPAEGEESLRTQQEQEQEQDQENPVECCVQALKFRVWNVVTQVPLSAEGRDKKSKKTPARADGIEFGVIQQLPRLHISGPDLSGVALGGEVSTGFLFLENVGAPPVEVLEVNMKGLQVDEEALKASLPLAPGKAIRIDYWASAEAPGSGGRRTSNAFARLEEEGSARGLEEVVEVQVLYARRRTSSYWRRLVWKTKRAVEPSVEISNVRIRECWVTDALLEKKTRKMEVRREEEENLDKHHNIVNLMPRLVSSSSSLPPPPLSTSVVEPCLEQRGCQAAVLEMDVINHSNILLSLYVAVLPQLNVSFGEGADEVTVKRFSLHPRSVKRISLLVRKFEAPAEEAGQDEDPPLGKRALTAEEKRTAAARRQLDRMRDLLLSHVRVSWSSSGSRRGLVNLLNIQLEASDVSCLRPAQVWLQASFVLEDATASSSVAAPERETEFGLVTGTFYTCSVSVFSFFSSSLPLLIKLEIRRGTSSESPSLARVQDLPDGALIAGASCCQVMARSGESPAAVHQLGVCFLVPGAYTLLASCYDADGREVLFAGPVASISAEGESGRGEESQE